jgi:hypothetical protein
MDDPDAAKISNQVMVLMDDLSHLIGLRPEDQVAHIGRMVANDGSADSIRTRLAEIRAMAAYAAHRSERYTRTQLAAAFGVSVPNADRLVRMGRALMDGEEP